MDVRKLEIMARRETVVNPQLSESLNKLRDAYNIVTRELEEMRGDAIDDEESVEKARDDFNEAYITLVNSITNTITLGITRQCTL